MARCSPTVLHLLANPIQPEPIETDVVAKIPAWYAFLRLITPPPYVRLTNLIATGSSTGRRSGVDPDFSTGHRATIGA